MQRDRAAYMRAYRAKHNPRPEAPIEAPPAPKAPRDAALDVANRRIADLEAEIHRLKVELARRPLPLTSLRPFGSPSPAPKPSQSRTSGRGRAG